LIGGNIYRSRMRDRAERAFMGAAGTVAVDVVDLGKSREQEQRGA